MNKYTSLEEVRTEIDKLDRQIVALLCERQVCVSAAADFKKDSGEVKAPDRVEQLIGRIRELAAEYGGHPELMERIYRGMVSAFIEHELRLHGGRNTEPAEK